MKRSIHVLFFLALQVYPVCMSAQSAKPPAPNPNDVRAPDPATHPKPIQYDTSGTVSPQSIAKKTVHKEPVAATPASVTIIDPQIPGIQIIRPSDAEFASLPEIKQLRTPNGFAIRNTGKKTVIGMATKFLMDDNFTKASVILSGLGGSHRLTPGEVAVTEEGSLFLPNYKFRTAAMQGKKPVSATIRYVLFEDGSFYGSKEDAEKLETARKVETEFFSAAAQAKYPDAYVEGVEKCGKDVKCAQASGKGADYWNAMNRATGIYRSSQAMAGQQFAAKLKRHATSRQSFPVVKWIAEAAPAAGEKPDGSFDGWYISSLYGWMGYSIAVQSVTSTVQLPLDYISQISKGDPPNPLGVSSGVENIVCFNPLQYSGNETRLMNVSLTAGIAQRGLTNELYVKYAPNHFFFTSITSNYNANNDGWLGDQFIWGAEYGYPAPVGLTANDDGGDTECEVRFKDRPEDDWTYVLLTLDNTTLEDPVKGYNVYNVSIMQSCAGAYDKYPQDSDYQLLEPYDSGISCIHNGPEVADNGGGGSCDPLNDFCCCMASFNNDTYCGEDLEPVDSCGTQPTAIATVTAVGKVPPVGVYGSDSTTPTVSEIGIARRGNSYLLDGTNVNQFIDGTTRFINPGFTAPDGGQLGDVPVSGDWTGTGRSCLGIFRPLSGTWWLDKNCDNVFESDGTEGPYQFGGLVDNQGNPQDIPVVGDWVGRGKGCIGIFRKGLWLLDMDCDGVFTPGWDIQIAFGGLVGDVPVVGYWGQSPAGLAHPIPQLGVVRCYQPFAAPNDYCYGYPYYWILDAALTNDVTQNHHVVSQAFPYGGQGPSPVHWNNASQASLYMLFNGPWPTYNGDIYVTGDWLGTGISYPGIYRQGAWIEDLTGAHTYDTLYWFGGVGPISYLGWVGDFPLVGKW